MGFLEDLGYSTGSGLSLSGAETTGPAFGGGYSLDVPTSLDFSLPELPNFNLQDFQSIDSAPPISAEPLGQGPQSGGGFMDYARGIVEGAPDASTIGSGLQGIARGILPAAQLGLAGLGVKAQLDAAKLGREQSKQRGQMQQVQRQAIEPLRSFGAQALNQAQAGQIDPSAQSMIDQWVEGAKQQAKQWFASNGISDSTMMESMLADIDNKAVSMRHSVLGMNRAQAIKALHAAVGGATMGAETASREESELDGLIRASNQALAALSGAAA